MSNSISDSDEEVFVEVVSNDEDFVAVVSNDQSEDEGVDEMQQLDLTKDVVELDRGKLNDLPRLIPNPVKQPLAPLAQPVHHQPIQTAIRSSPLKRRPGRPLKVPNAPISSTFASLGHPFPMPMQPRPGMLQNRSTFPATFPDNQQPAPGSLFNRPPNPDPFQLFPPLPRSNANLPPKLSPLVHQKRPITPTTANPKLAPDKPKSHPIPRDISQQRPPIPQRPKPPKLVRPHEVPYNPIEAEIPSPPTHQYPMSCSLCKTKHPGGQCRLRDEVIQSCPACGYYHLHLQRTCPLLQDLGYVEAMYKRLKESTEDRNTVKAAKLYIQSVQADLQLRARGGRPLKKKNE